MNDFKQPKKTYYDVIIVGGAIMGSSVAWFLSNNEDFDGSILIVERDPSYEKCSTSHTNSCIRQQFSSELNIKISQFTANYLKNFRDEMGGNKEIPNLKIQNFGYLYLSDNNTFSEILKNSQELQIKCGAETQILNAEEIKKKFPFYNVSDIQLGSHNIKDEGYFEGSIMFEWWRKSAKKNNVEYLHNEVVSMSLNNFKNNVDKVILSTGEEISCGTIVNASGPRAFLTSKMAGIEIPIEPRKRFTYIFSSNNPLDQELPLTIDPSGIHMRQYGGNTYMAGCFPDPDPAVDYDDFEEDHDMWENHLWPLIANRVPQFDALKVESSWAGHYAYNYLDHNAVIGRHDIIKNFIFINGFSGHGLQQSPAMGRGVSELIIYNEFKSIDLSPFSFSRIKKNEPIIETAII